MLLKRIVILSLVKRKIRIGYQREREILFISNSCLVSGDVSFSNSKASVFVNSRREYLDASKITFNRCKVLFYTF